MLKTLLKSSVSAFILLGTIATINPTQAGNGGLGGEKKEEEKGILVPLKGKPKTQPALFINPFKEAEDNRSILPQEGWLAIFKYLDYKNTMKAAQVCKNWTWIINPQSVVFMKPFKEEENNHSVLPQDVLLASFEYLDYNDILNAEQVCKNWAWIINKANTMLDVNHLVLHPSSIFRHQQRFASLCFSENEFVMPAISTVEDLLDKQKGKAHVFINRISNQLSKDKNLCKFLGRKYINLDPCQDFQEVYLASNIVSNSPQLKILLWEVVKTHNIDFDNIPANFMDSFWQVLGFRECTIKNPEAFQDYQDLQQSLMALKLLGLTGDQDAQNELQKFSNYLTLHVSQASPFIMDDPEFWDEAPVRFTQDRTEEQYHFFSNYLKWAAYVNDSTDFHSYIAQFYTILHFCPKVVLDPQIVKSFGNSRNLASLPIPYFSSLLHIYRQQDNRDKILKTLNQYYEKIEKSDIHSILSITDDYKHEEEYGKALSILETASKEFQDSLSGDFLNLQKAKLCLANQDQQNFPLSKEHIQIILNHFSEEKNLLRFFPNNGTTCCNFWKHEVLPTKAVLDIYEGNFITAYQELKTADEVLAYLNNGEETPEPKKGSASASSEDHSGEDSDSELSYWYGEDKTEYIFEHFFTNGLIKAVATQIQHPDFPSELLYFIGEKISHILSNFSELDYENQRVFKKLVFKHQDVLRHILQCLHYHHVTIGQEPTDGIEKLEILLQS